MTSQARIISKTLQCTPFSWRLFVEGSYARKTNDAYSDLDLGLIIPESNFLRHWRYITTVLGQQLPEYYVLPVPPSTEYPTFALCFLLNLKNPFHLVDISIRSSVVGWRGTRMKVASHKGTHSAHSLLPVPPSLKKRELQSIAALVMLLKLQKAILRHERNTKNHAVANRIVSVYFSPLIKASEARLLTELGKSHEWEKFLSTAVRIWKRTEPTISNAKWKAARQALLQALGGK